MSSASFQGHGHYWPCLDVYEDNGTSTYLMVCFPTYDPDLDNHQSPHLNVNTCNHNPIKKSLHITGWDNSDLYPMMF